MSNQSKRINFPGSQGFELAARLELPPAQTHAFALFAHCFSGSKDVLTAVRLSKALNAQGIAMLRFDFTGLGNSQGDFANTNFSSNVEDLIRAADFLRQKYDAPQLLIGHSLGGAAVLAVAAQIPEVRAVATINAPSDPAHVSHHFSAAIENIREKGEAEVLLAGRKFRIQKQFLEDIAEQNLLDKVSKLRKPLMIFHSPVDSTVNIKHAAAIYQAAKHPKSFVSLDDADHMVTRTIDAEFMANTLSSWADRYLSTEPAQVDELFEGVTVAESEESLLTQTIKAGRHWLRADELQTFGGKDLGPSPYDLLLASLGACTAMTLRMYAERKKISLKHVSVELRHGKIHAKDCQECETREGRVDHIEREITLEGQLSEDQRARLLAIAERCPVHRTLQSEVSVSTRLVD